MQRILVRAGMWPALSRLELSCRNGQNYLGLFRNNKRDTERQNQLPTETWEWRSLRKAAFGKYRVIIDDMVPEGFPTPCRTGDGKFPS